MAIFSSTDISELRDLAADLALHDTCAIKVAGEASDGSGGYTVEWSDGDTVACGIQSQSGFGSSFAVPDGEGRTADVRLPAGTVVKPGDLLVTGNDGLTLQIVHVDLMGDLAMYTTVSCAERGEQPEPDEEP